MSLRQLEWLTQRYRERLKREDRRAGEIVALLFNVNRDTDKTSPIEWQDVFPEWKEEPPEQSEEEMFQVMQLLATAHSDGGVPST